MHNYKLVIEYDGTDFCGWQIQPGLRTVQGVIEDALLRLTGKKTTLICGGRTDSGVHAFGQTANFKSAIAWGSESICHALNRALPEDITVLRCDEVDQEFHARFNATGRSYRFQLYHDRSSLRRRTHWCYWERDINFASLQRLARKIMGENDFRSFCVKKSHRASNLCTISKSCWTKKGKEYTFHIVSNRFLHGMVRSLVGTMVRVASGNLSESDFEQLLKEPKRSAKSYTAPSCGLYLMEIIY